MSQIHTNHLLTYLKHAENTGAGSKYAGVDSAFFSIQKSYKPQNSKQHGKCQVVSITASIHQEDF